MRGPKEESFGGEARAPSAMPALLVVGLGNPLLGDDGVGWRVIDALEARLRREPSPLRPRVELDRLSVGGLTLMERLVDHRRVVLVDALLTGRREPGTVTRSLLADLPTRDASHLDNAHDASLVMALAAGRAMGARLPDEVVVVGIEARTVDVFGEELSAPVAAAVPHAVEVLLAELARPD